jgi:cupin 2 domain-containing protein
MIFKGSIYSEPKTNSDGQEVFEVLKKTDKILIERIITKGALKEPGEWYDQDKDEWVMLVRGEAKIEFRDGIISSLHSGDYIFIPAHLKHRVIATSELPDCIWLAIHGDLS